jgi:hypothetical protein
MKAGVTVHHFGPRKELSDGKTSHMFLEDGSGLHFGARKCTLVHAEILFDKTGF